MECAVGARAQRPRHVHALVAAVAVQNSLRTAAHMSRRAPLPAGKLTSSGGVGTGDWCGAEGAGWGGGGGGDGKQGSSTS